MKYRVLIALCSAPLVNLVATTSAQADEKRLDTVSVTAVHKATDLVDIPASVEILTDETLDVANALNSAEDVTRLLTGVQAAVANGSQVAFQIRGIGAVDHQALTPGAAAVYQDGVYLATNVQTGLMLYDLERVEVLKGPQGTLYGRNASSGAINFLSRSAASEQLNYVDASYGRFERLDLSGGYGGDLSDEVSYRVAGRYLEQGPVLDNVQSNPAIATGPEAAGGERDELGLRASLAWDAREATSLLLRAHYEQDRGINPTPRNDALNIGKHEISSEGDGIQNTDNEFFGASARAITEIEGWSVTSLTAIEGYNQQYGFDFDGTPAPFGVSSLNANLSYDRGFVQVSEELHVQKSFGWGDALLGGFASYDDFEQRYVIWCGVLDPDTLVGTCPYVGAAGRVGPNPASPGVARTLVTDIEQSRTTLALFSYNDINLTDRLTLTVGGRFTHESIEGEGRGQHVFDDGTIALNNRDGAGPAIGSNEIDEDRFSGNLALRYAFDGIGTAYVSVANGYKSGGFNGEVQNNALHFADEGLFDAETVTSYEAGFKSAVSDPLSWSLAAFYQDYDAPQARIFVSFDLPDGATIISNSLSNLDEATAYGLEVSGRWSPVKNLDLDAGVTFLETEISQTNNLGGNAALFDGNALPFSSDVTGRLSARYTRAVMDDVGATATVSAKYNGAFYLDAEGLETRRQDAYTLLDASLALRFDQNGLEVGLWGRNLLNEDYATSGYGFIGYNTFRSDPATYGVRLRYEFQSTTG